MIVADTSVWIAFFRGRPKAVADRLDALLEADEVALVAPVRVELLGGVRAAEGRRIRHLLGGLPLWLPRDETWDLIEEWVTLARSKGQRFGVGDLLIAAIAVGREASVWSLDGDFARLASLGFVDLADA